MVPVDVVSGILIKLPVKSLLRFKCVSNEWHSLINEPYFINLHLHRSIQTNRHDLHIVHTNIYSGPSEVRSLNSDYVNLGNPRKLIHPLKRPQEDEYGHIIILGSCNGLVCLRNETSRTTALWNISTGDYRFLPHVPMELTVAECVSLGYVYGLGHDSINDDYKLVRVAAVKVPPTEPKIIGKTIVYSLRTNTWRRGEEIPYCLLSKIRRQNVFVCGALHWVAVDNTTWPMISSAIIIAFDVGTEKYRQLELLDNMRGKHLVLGALGGCLCATEDMPPRVNIWSMKDYGVKDSWTKLFSFGTDNIHSLRPLAYSKTRGKLLAEAYGIETYTQTLIWYDVKDKEVKEVDQLKIPRAEICMGSLVQL